MAAVQDYRAGSTTKQFAKASFPVSLIVFHVGLLKINKVVSFSEMSVNLKHTSQCQRAKQFCFLWSLLLCQIS